MTPKEAFEIWWVDVGAPHVLSPKYSSKDDLKAAWLEATRQAYEDASRICEFHVITDDNSSYQGGFVSMIKNSCAEAIRQRIKEYDNDA